MTRIRRLLLVAITLVASLTAGPLIADGGFVGVWKLVSYSTQDPDTHAVFYPFGEPRHRLHRVHGRGPHVRDPRRGGTQTAHRR